MNAPDLRLGTPHFPDGSQDWARHIALLGPAAAAAAAKGPFAVALTLEDGRIFLAADRFAQQTLCYRVSGGRLQYSERADELGGDGGIDPQAIFEYLYFHVIPSPRTIFRDVRRLPPGHCAVFENGVLTVSPYWTPRFEPDASPSFETQRERFRGLLRNAVGSRLGTGVPACFLSGGTDSSTVAGMIGQACGRQAVTYAIGFDAEGYDEMAFARIAARHFGTDHREYYVTPDDLVRGIGTVAASYDQPFGNSSALPAYYCALKARTDGVDRMLAGDGGDELFGGNSRYAMQRVFGWYGQLPPALRSAIVEPFFGLAAVSKVPLLRRGAGYVRQARVPLPDRMQMYNLLRRLGTETVLEPEFLGSLDVEAVLRQQREVWAASQADNELDRMLAFDWRYTLAESDLPKVRGTTSLAGVEVAFPFLDDELLAFSMTLPTSYKLRGTKLRWFFKEALRGFLPDEILTKKKQGFGLPFGVWANRHDRLRALAADSLSTVGQRGIVRPEFLRVLLDTHLKEHPGYYGELVWILMMLEQWFRVHAPDYRHAP